MTEDEITKNPSILNYGGDEDNGEGGGNKCTKKCPNCYGKCMFTWAHGIEHTCRKCGHIWQA